MSAFDRDLPHTLHVYAEKNIKDLVKEFLQAEKLENEEVGVQWCGDRPISLEKFYREVPTGFKYGDEINLYIKTKEYSIVWRAGYFSTADKNNENSWWVSITKTERTDEKIYTLIESLEDSEKQKLLLQTIKMLIGELP